MELEKAKNILNLKEIDRLKKKQLGKQSSSTKLSELEMIVEQMRIDMKGLVDKNNELIRSNSALKKENEKTKAAVNKVDDKEKMIMKRIMDD